MEINRTTLTKKEEDFLKGDTFYGLTGWDAIRASRAHSVNASIEDRICLAIGLGEKNEPGSRFAMLSALKEALQKLQKTKK